MGIKIGILLGMVLFYSSESCAVGSDFIFRVNNETYRFPASCIEHLEFHDKSDDYPERVNMNLTGECGEKLSDLTTQNMGKVLEIYYKDQRLIHTLILSRLKSGIMLETKNVPRVILMQMLADYGVKPG
ncbi:hypothetical protein [Dickeya zeae]|uniref:hypothetical protein n=1 Tax=Dickeya zeae TaxID=204042 RepID=UPI0005762088|nr:hypothetical protein [Dickeya zeae]